MVILNLIEKYDALPEETILDFFQSRNCTFMERLVRNVDKYPLLYNVLKEYYRLHPDEINNTGTDNRTPLMNAVYSSKLTNFFLKNGANVHHEDYDECTALHDAIYSNNLKSVKLLLEYDGNTTNEKYKDIVHNISLLNVLS